MSFFKSLHLPFSYSICIYTMTYTWVKKAQTNKQKNMMVLFCWEKKTVLLLDSSMNKDGPKMAYCEEIYGPINVY